MTAAAAITIEGVSKKFCRSLKRSLWYGVRDLASEVAGRQREANLLRPLEFWALRELSFEVHQGEILGLIGPNGAGKSTLLKILSGLVRPDGGRVEVRGNVQALISLGVGFNPVLTGRENIQVNAAILGISRQDLRRQFDEIVAFSELADFIDTPVMSYSTGMKARLGFAIAVFSRPDILLVDEVLSVGDLRFRRKALEKMLSLLNSGVTVIFVSHSLDQVERICHRAVYLKQGQVQSLGECHQVVLQYIRENLRLEAADAAARTQELMDRAKAALPDQFVVTDVTVTDSSGAPNTTFRPRDDIGVRIGYVPRRVVGAIKGMVQFCRLDGSVIASSVSEPVRVNGVPESEREIECVFRSVPMNEGIYHVAVSFEDVAGRLYSNSAAASFEINATTEELAARGSYQAVLALDSEWRLHESRSPNA